MESAIKETVNCSKESGKTEIVLFSNKEDCCGCGACMNACMKQAIHMKEDEYGFMYPEIDPSKCVQCGICQKACGYQYRKETAEHQLAYVAMAKDELLLKRSASGGIFAALATEILKKGGVVFGSSLEYKEGALTPEHIKVDHISDLHKLQGSKYVQSSIGNTYRQVKEELETKKEVLFSGTPCQIAGLKSYLGDREYKNLFTVDIICHGVPSAKFFKSYLSVFEKKLHGKIIDFKFRDKNVGWGLLGRVLYLDKNKHEKNRVIKTRMSSYYTLFLKSDIYRDSCYNCKYASSHRPADLSIGDYWGIQKEHPEYLVGMGGTMDETKGISCIIVNTERGKVMLEQLGAGLEYKASSFEKVARGNEQLNHPSFKSERRDKILNLYKEKGYSAVEDWYYRQMGIKKCLYIVWDAIPQKFKGFLHR